MITFIQNIYNYILLINSIRNYINNYNNTGNHSDILLDIVIDKINICGSVAIKFTQWSLPKLELLYDNNNNKSSWLIKLEKFYEDCNSHSLEYTIDEYKNTFNKELTDDYEIIDMIGSGSMGQTYLIKDKPMTKYQESNHYVLKILHPNIQNEINFFKKFYNIIKYFPIIKTILNNKFPFDINTFITQFNEQSNFVHESNNLLKFKEYYKNNDFIIVPDLIKTSENIMIMSYEKGERFEDLDLSEYQLNKIALLLVSFTRNNQQILNFHHGDLHKGNWKIKSDTINNHHKLIIYDFGFCWEVPKYKEYGIDLICDIFEKSDPDPENIDINKLIYVLKYLIKYDINEEELISEKVEIFLQENIDKIKPWTIDPIRLLKFSCEFCTEYELLLDPILVQAFIIVIQCQKIFSKYNIVSSDQDPITGYKVYREKFLDWISFYETYNIFNEFSQFLKDKFKEENITVNNIFDTIEMPESIKNLAIS